MPRVVRIAFVSTFAALLLLSGASGQETAPSPDLTGRYCISCHNDALRTAGVSLEGLDSSQVTGQPAIWEKVLRKVGSGEMPPPDVPGPGAEERARFVLRLERTLDEAASADPDPGSAPARRLNRAEYANAVRDLLGMDLDVSSMLPVDDSGYGFDNIADVLSLTPALLDRYMFAARRVSRLAIGTAAAKPEKDIYVRDRETGFREAGHARISALDLPLGSVGGAGLRYYFPRTGEYVIETALDEGDSRTGYQHHEFRLRIEGGMHTLAFAFPGQSSRPELAGPGATGATTRSHPPLDVRIDGRRIRLVEPPDSARPLKLRWISIEGPFKPEGPGDTPSRRRIFSCRPSDGTGERACAREILGRLARGAYRRPAGRDDVSALMAVFDSGYAEGGFEHGIERALRALLVSPSFLFRIESDPDGVRAGPTRPVSGIELASRLSFFLWSSLPDEELLEAGERGRLGEPVELERQVRRMLADPRSSALVDNFAGQWLELRKVSKVKPDEVLFPEFDDALRYAMRRETELFFADILRNNRSVLELLESDRAFLNERLARHYGIEGVHGSQFREVRLPDDRRGGLLGQASVLTVTSYPNRTSVVIRGKWVLENLFGMPPPPPPPDIPELEEAADEGLHLTLRELMTLHSRSPTCASCHVRMDPIGFALENYDAIGRWRERDGGVEIDASGELPGGIAFEGPAGLKHALARDLRDAFARTVTEKLLTYALGRGLEYYDRPTVRSIMREAEASGYRLADMIAGVARSIPFQMRRIPES